LGLWVIAVLLVIVLFLDRNSWLHDPKPDLLIPVGFINRWTPASEISGAGAAD